MTQQDAETIIRLNRENALLKRELENLKQEFNDSIENGDICEQEDKRTIENLRDVLNKLYAERDNAIDRCKFYENTLTIIKVETKEYFKNLIERLP